MKKSRLVTVILLNIFTLWYFSTPFLHGFSIYENPLYLFASLPLLFCWLLTIEGSTLWGD